jgi:hypothetical protein
MASYNRYNNQSKIDTLGNTVENRGYFNKMLRNLSNWGMDYENMVLRNTYSVGMHEDPQGEGADYGTNMYDIFTKKVISKMLDRKSIAYLDRAYQDKRKILRQYSIKDEIKDFVTQISDEAIIYNEDNYFCKLKDMPDEFDNSLKQRYQENFNKIYRNFGFNDGLTAWNYFKNFLIDGYIAFEIVYDNKQKNIIDLQPIDPMTLVVTTDPGTGTIVWIQYPDNPQIRRVLLDSQIIYISYSNNNEFAETSYVENLIRPYNQLKMIEQTRMLYNINQAAIYKKFIIPTNGLTRQQAEQQIYELMSEYHEDVQWDDTMGTVTINGSTNIPHSKDFWFPNSDLGSPDIEIMQSQGTDLNEDTMLNWFYKNLKRASKLPFSRFDEDSGGGNIYNDSSEITRDEIKYGNFIKRLRTVFKELIVKPIKIQMILDFPELKDDNLFHTNLQVIFNSNELFEEWKYLNNLAKRAEIASTLSSNLMDADEKPYLHVEWIIRKIMKFSDADIAENNKYKLGGGGMAPGQGGGAGGAGDAGDAGGAQGPGGAQSEGAQGEGGFGEEGGAQGSQGQPGAQEGGSQEGGGFEF